MSPYKVDFDALPWMQGRPGVRFKVHAEGARRLRLVEFATSEGDPGWCEAGHVGYVLSGALTIEFSDQEVSFVAGEGLFIPSGASAAHRGTLIEPGTRLLLVEDN